MFSTCTFTPFSVTSLPVTFVFRRNFMPCLVRHRCSVDDTSASFGPATWSLNSTTSTFEAKRRHTEPSSSPITPAPTTIRRFATLLSFSAPVLSIIRSFSLSTGRGGMARLTSLDSRRQAYVIQSLK